MSLDFKNNQVKKITSTCKKKHYGKVITENGNCPSGGRKKKCHWIFKISLPKKKYIEECQKKIY